MERRARVSPAYARRRARGGVAVGPVVSLWSVDRVASDECPARVRRGPCAVASGPRSQWTVGRGALYVEADEAVHIWSPGDCEGSCLEAFCVLDEGCVHTTRQG